MSKYFKYIFFVLLLQYASGAFSQQLIQLFCKGEWGNERVQQEFLLYAEEKTGFMIGYDPTAAIGLVAVDDREKHPINPTLKCHSEESKFFCTGSNRVGVSTLELSRYTGKLKSTTLLKGEKNFIMGNYQCEKPPIKKF